ncbi:unnamed protein product [Oreochromis niloticus]|nr:unnamed protein product [Mustela putorius furo]
MMKLILSLTLFCAICSTAGALQCLTCKDVTCLTTNPVMCTIEKACVTASILVTSSGIKVPQIIRGCAPDFACPVLGSQTYSANLGILSAAASVECCNKNDCNLNILPVPADQSENNLKCFSCDPGSTQCNSTVKCSGVENRCFQAFVPSGISTSVPVKGCMSENICTAVSNLSSLPVLNLGNVSCCDNNLCNTALTTTTTFIYLLFGLIYIIY